MPLDSLSSALSDSPVERLTLDGRISRVQNPSDLLAEINVQSFIGDPRTFNGRAIRLDKFLLAQFNFAEARLLITTGGRTRYVVLFLTHGRIEIQTTARQYAANEDGALVVFPGIDEYELVAKGPVKGILFTFESSEVAPFEMSSEAISQLPIATGACLGIYALLDAMVNSSTDLSTAEGNGTRHLLSGVARALVDLAGVRTETLSDRVHTLIQRRHTEQDLTVDQIARILRVSRSTLNRSVPAIGVSELLRHERTRTALRMQSQQPQMPLTDLAAMSGFSSISTLRRALTKGRPPLAVGLDDPADQRVTSAQ